MNTELERDPYLAPEGPIADPWQIPRKRGVGFLPSIGRIVAALSVLVWVPTLMFVIESASLASSRLGNGHMPPARWCALFMGLAVVAYFFAQVSLATAGRVGAALGAFVLQLLLILAPLALALFASERDFDSHKAMAACIVSYGLVCLTCNLGLLGSAQR